MGANRKDMLFAYAEALRVLVVSLELPTDEYVRAWTDGSLAEGIRSMMACLDLKDGVQVAVMCALEECNVRPPVLGDLRRDHTRLFGHPKAPLVPFYQSQFLAKQRGDEERPLLVVNRTALSLDETYRGAGLAHRPGSTVSGDRMDIELTFLAVLLDRGDVDRARVFVADYLSAWAPNFFRQVEQNADTPEYRFVGVLGEAIFA